MSHVAQIEDPNLGVGFNPNPRTPLIRLVGTIHHPTFSRDFHLMPVNIASTPFDGNDWLSFVVLVIALKGLGVDVNNRFG